MRPLTRVAIPCGRLLVSLAALASDAAGPIRTSSAEDDKKVIERIVADWGARSDKLRTIHCIVEGAATSAKGCYNGGQYTPKYVRGDVPVDDHSHQIRYDWLFDFEKGRYRIESRGEVFDAVSLKFVPHVTVTAFDGSGKPKLLARREWNTSVAYAPPATQPELYVNLASSQLETKDMVMLFAHGALPRAGAVLPAGGVASSRSGRRVFVLHGRAERNGRECIVLRSMGRRPTEFTEYWVDRERQSAIVHWEDRVPPGRKLYDVDIEYEEVSGLWLPKHIDYTKYRPQPENPPELVCRMNVTSLLPNAPVSADMFELEPEVGMIVSDNMEHRRYRFGVEASSDGTEPVARLITILALAALGSCFTWRLFSGRTKRVNISPPL